MKRYKAFLVSLLVVVFVTASNSLSALAESDASPSQKSVDASKGLGNDFQVHVRERQSDSKEQDSNKNKADSAGIPKIIAPVTPECVAVGNDGQQLCRSQLQDFACRAREVAAWVADNPDGQTTAADANQVNDRIQKQCIDFSNPDPSLGLSRDELVRMAFHRFEPQVLAPKVQPDPARGAVPVNIPANFWSLTRAAQDSSVTLLGESITLRAIPVSWRWNFDDDTRPHTSVYPGRECFTDRKPCYSYNTVRHRFTLVGDFDVKVTVVFRGEYAVNGAPFTAIEGTTIARTSPLVTLHTLQGRARLIDPNAVSGDEIDRREGSPSRPTPYRPSQYQPKRYQPKNYRPTPYRPTPYQPKKYRPHQHQTPTFSPTP